MDKQQEQEEQKRNSFTVSKISESNNVNNKNGIVKDAIQKRKGDDLNGINFYDGSSTSNGKNGDSDTPINKTLETSNISTSVSTLSPNHNSSGENQSNIKASD